MFNGGVFPHAFIMPPRKTGIYVISQFLKIGEVCSVNILISQRRTESGMENDSNRRASI